MRFRFRRCTVAFLSVTLWGATAARAESLLELYRTTLETNPALKSREYGIDRAEAQKDQAFSKLLPQLVAIGTYSLNDYHQQAGASANPLTRSPAVSTQYDGMRGTLQLKQALFDLASYFQWQSADYVILQSREELEAARIAVAGDLVDRYLAALQATDDIAYVVGEKAAAHSQSQRLKSMYERQLAKVTDYLEVEAYEQSLNTKEIEAKNARAVALEKLRELVGTEVRDVRLLSRDNLPPVTRPVDEWVSAAIVHNPNLTALQHAIEAADQAESGSWAGHAPQVSLVLSETYSDLGFDNRTQPPYRVGSANLQLSVPIYEGGRAQAAVRESTARLEIARQQYEQKRREVERETRTAYLDALTGHARIDSAAQEARSQSRAAEAQQKGFELGVTTIVDLLDTRRRLLKAQTEQSKARYDFVRSLVGLHVWAGDLAERDIEEIDRWMAQSDSK